MCVLQVIVGVSSPFLSSDRNGAFHKDSHGRLYDSYSGSMNGSTYYVPSNPLGILPAFYVVETKASTSSASSSSTATVTF